jgi:dihydrofolate reductase
MGKLIFGAITSLDGYVADEDGNWDWSRPDEEVHRFVNDVQRSIGTQLYGRRMYEVLAAWETMGGPDEPDVINEYAEIWRAADKIVYSKTMDTVASERTRIERDFDPQAVRELKAEAERDLMIGGPNLAARAFEAGLIDECHLWVSPVIVGGGNQALPDGVRLDLELLDERRFGNGAVYLRYAATSHR